MDIVLSNSLQAQISDVLRRFADRITRVVVHLSDVNGDRSGKTDKRYLMEARVEGRDPVVVSNEGATPEMAALGEAQ